MDPTSVPTLPDDAVLATVGRFVTRYPGSAWLDLLARRVGAGVSGADDLVARARAGDLAGTDPTDLARFGHVLAAAAEDPADLEVVATVLDHAMASGASVDSTTRSVWLQALLLSGRLDAGASGPTEGDVDAEHWWSVRADLVNPYRPRGAVAAGTPDRAPTDADEVERWLEVLNSPFTHHGLAPLRLLTGSGRPFDRLAAAPVDDTGGSLVSVVMPVHDPGPSLRTAVRSVLDQSWTDVEVLLCDDASTVGRELIDECAALDPRVRVLRAERNGGAYRARNLGLAHARGRYLTFQDADDHSHPQRLERQVRALAERPGTVATMSHTLRATDALLVTALGLRKVALNMSSLLVDRERVVGALGGFDPVRRSGDRELIGRLEAAFGSRAVVTLPEPLAVCQLTPGSLSRGEMGFLRRDPARQAYATAAAAWHREIAAGRERPFLEPGVRAPFPAPDWVATGVRSEDAGEVDVALLADPAGNAPTDIGPLVGALCDAGQRVGVVDLPGPEDVCRPVALPGPTLAERFRSGRARWVLPEERVAARVAVLHDPAAVLTASPERLRRVEAEHLVLVADHVGGDAALVAAAERAAAIWPGRVHWMPADRAVAEHLRAVLPTAHLLPDAPWMVASAEPAPGWPGPSGRGSGPAVVGVLPPYGVDRPTRAAWARTLVPQDPATEVLRYGWGPPRIMGRPVTRVRPRDVGWADFLDRVDYLVAPPMATPRLTGAVVDAWARGTVVLADEALRPRLGDVAVGPEGGSVDDLLAADLADPSRYAERQQRGRDWVSRHAAARSVADRFAEVVAALDTRP